MIREITITSLSGRGSMYMKSREYFGYWLGPVDWGQVDGDHQTYAYLNQVGKSIVSTTVGTRPLSITGWVVDGDGKIQERCDALNAFISPVEDYSLEYNGKKINFRPDSSVVYSREYKRNNEKVRRFLIQGTCPYPLFSDKNDTAVPFDETGKLFRFPTDWGASEPLVFAISSKAYNVVVDNRGGFSAGFIAKIRFSGTVSNPKVCNLTTGKFIGIDKDFSSGQQIELCTIPGNKHILTWDDYGNAVSLIKYRNYKSSFDTVLVPGENVMAVECADLSQRANMEITLFYSRLYLEVE